MKRKDSQKVAHTKMARLRLKWCVSRAEVRPCTKQCLSYKKVSNSLFILSELVSDRIALPDSVRYVIYCTSYNA